MYDFMGQEISIGDTVIFQRPKYHGLGRAMVTKIGGKTITLNVIARHDDVQTNEKDWYQRWLTRYPNDCVVVDKLLPGPPEEAQP